MRLWHKDLIPVLPRQQLISQWRECCCIARNIKVNGTPNHLLVNKVMDYPLAHLVHYANLVFIEMENRGYKPNPESLFRWIDIEELENFDNNIPIYFGWHTERYFMQCYYNLQEKFDCGGITDKEWEKIENRYLELCLEE